MRIILILLACFVMLGCKPQANQQRQPRQQQIIEQQPQDGMFSPAPEPSPIWEPPIAPQPKKPPCCPGGNCPR